MGGAPPLLGNVSGAVLVGGTSSRMGRDKAALEIGGETYAGRIATRLGGLFEDVLLVGGDAKPGSRARRVVDVPGPRCALRGLVTALTHATAERVVVVATDLPLVTPDLLLALTAWPEAPAVVPRDESGLQPLCAIYARDAVLPVASRRLEAGALKLSGLLDEVGAALIEGEDLGSLDPSGTALFNANTPEDHARVEGWIVRGESLGRGS